MKARFNSLVVALPLALAALSSSAFAADASWNWPNYNSATNWSSTLTWSTAPAFPGATTGTSNTDIATFSAFGDQIITVPGNLNIGGITFASPGAFTNDYYFTSGSLLPTAGAVIQADSTFRGVANFNTPVSAQGSLTITSNGLPGSQMFLAGAMATPTAAGAATLTLNGSNSGQTTHANNLISSHIGQGVLTTLTTTAASSTATAGSATGLVIGQSVLGNPNIPAGTTISGISGTTITLSAAATAAGTNINTSFADSGTSRKLVKNGTGSWVLSAANTFAGGTDLNGGMIYAANAQALGSSGTISVLGTTTIRTTAALTDPSARISIADGATLVYDTHSVGANGPTTSWTGQISTSGGTNTAAFTKTGLGELTLTMGTAASAGISQSWRGDTTISAGNLYVSLNALAAADRTNVLSPDSRLVFGGGNLRWQGKTGNTTSQTFNGTLVKPGVSQVIMSAGTGTNTFTLGAITRDPGALLNFVTVSGYSFATSNSNDTAGALKGVLWTIGNDFARVNAGNLAAATYTTQNDATNWTSDAVIYTTGAAVTGVAGSGGTTDIGGIKLNHASSQSFSIDGILRTANGIIFGSAIGANASEISGGSLTSTSGDLIVVNNNNQNTHGRNTISSTIVDNGSPTNVIFYNAAQVSGVARSSLFISGNNTYTGNTYVGGGQNNATGFHQTVIGGAAGASIGSIGATVFVNGGTGGPSNVLCVGNNDATGDVKGTIDLANGRLSLNRNDSFTLGATVGGTTGAGSISQDSTGTATVNLASGSHFFQSIGSTGSGTLNLAGSGTYTTINAAAGFHTGSTTRFNSGSYYFGSPGNSGANSTGTWIIDGADVTIAGGRWFNSGGGTVTLNSGSFKVNGPALNSQSQAAGNIIYNVTGGTFTTGMASNTGSITALGLGVGAVTATGLNQFNQSGGAVNVGVPNNANTSSAVGLGLHIGVGASTHESTYNLSGGTLRVFGSTGISVFSAAAPGTGGSNNFNWTGGTLTIAGYNSAFLTSSTVADTLVQNGAGTILSPGDTYEGREYSGRTAITGNYQINSGKVAIGIGGTTAAASFHETPVNRFDNVTATGTVTLGGELVVSLRNAFVPAPTDSFTVITGTGGVSGTFSNISGGRVPVTGGGSFAATVSGTTVVLNDYVAHAGGDDYDTWAGDNGITGEDFEDDFDKDGLSNGVEYALGGNPTTSSQPAGVLSGNTITFTKGADAIANADVTWIIETSTTLAAGSWTAEVTQAAGSPAASIAYTFTPGSPEKKFARLKVVRVPAP